MLKIKLKIKLKIMKNGQSVFFRNAHSDSLAGILFKDMGFSGEPR
jgi:hypothetical protein